jgi:peptide/nickel transport system permease protein
MLSFVLRRLGVLVATLIVATLIVFAALEALPGNAAQTMLGASATPEAVAALAHKLGLDQPFYARYLSWVGGALHGDLGLSYAYNSSIASLIGDRLAVTLPLTLLAMVVASGIALCAGIYAAERRGRPGDAAVMALSQFGLAIPNFWLGVVLVLIFAVHWRVFPSGGFPGWSDPLKALRALILPALALGLVQAAILTRVTRSALVEAMGEDFMRTARAKGLSRSAALWRHASPPILVVAGLQFSSLIAGAVVVENVFVLPGLGRLIAQSIANRDVLVVENCVMLLAGLVILVNALVDVAAAAIDPRLRSA